MRFRSFAAVSFIAGLIVLAVACSPNQSPDQLRQQTAQATETVKQDTRAIAEGVKEGLTNKKAVDINKASKDELQTLPGITAARADRIVAERPYADTHQLVSRHVLSEDEYSQVADHVTVTH